jgi:hypothetical protein
VPAINNLRFFVSGVAQGQSSQFRGRDFDQIPTFVLGHRHHHHR